MKKLLLATTLLLMPACAFAQTAVQVSNCGNAAPANGSNSLYADSTGSLCVRGNLGGYSVTLTSTPTVQAAAYATGNAVGGLITLANATRYQASGIIQSVATSFVSGVVPNVDVILFSANPTGSTITDKTQIAIATADLTKVVAVIHLTDSTLLGTSAPSYVQALQQAVPFQVTANTTTLYAAVVMRSAATLTSTTDMTLALRILQD